MSTIPIPDTSGLGVESDISRYNLQNAATALAPQPSPPPAIGPDQAPAYQLPPEAFNPAPEFSQRPFDQLQIQPTFQQQFPQGQQPQLPQGPDAFTPFEQEINNRIAARDRVGHGLKGMLVNFAHGMGASMMHNAGLLTPEEQNQRDLGLMLDIQTARTNQQYRNAEAQNLALKTRDRYPITLSDGRTVMVSGEDAARHDLGRQQLEAKPDQKFSMDELISSSAMDDANRGLQAPSAKTAYLIQVKHASEAQKAGNDFERWYPKYLRDSKLPDTADNELTAKKAWTAASQMPERAERPPRSMMVVSRPDGSQQAIEVRPGDIIPAGATTVAGREKEVAAFNKSYVDPANQVEKSYRMMDQAYRDYQAARSRGQELPTGAQSMLALSQHLATTFGNVKGSRVTKDMIQEHLGARSISDSALVAIQRLTNGDQLSPDQWTAFHDLIGESRRLSWETATREAQRRNIPVDFVPRDLPIGGTSGRRVIDFTK